MCHRPFAVAMAAFAALFALGAAGDAFLVAEERRIAGVEPEALRHLVVIGLTGDDTVRRRFEDRFVSQLRGRGMEATPSHSVVADLTRIDDRAAVTTKLFERGVDGAVTVRFFALDRESRGRWGEIWGESVDAETTLRRLIEDSLPVVRSEQELYGVEVSLWSAKAGQRVWSGRANPMKRKQMPDAVTPFVGSVMNRWKNHGLM